MRRVFLLAAICCVVIPVYGQKARAKADAHQQSSTDTQPQKNDTINVDTVNINKLSVAEQTNPPEKPEKNTNKPLSYFQRLIAPENLPNLILCIVGIAGVIAAICTLRAINRQASIAERTLLLTQAADIHIVRFILRSPRDNPPLGTPQRMQVSTSVSMLVKNFGRTRAEQFINDLVMGIQGRPTRPVEPRNQIAVAIGADQEWNIGFGQAGTTLTPEVLANVQNGNSLLKIWGSMQYRDVFGNRYKIACEATYNPQSNDFFVDRYEHEREKGNQPN